MQTDLSSMRLLVATDAWEPQVNGVVKTMQRTIGMLRDRGAQVAIVEPRQFPRFPMPGYPEIPIALPRPSRIRSIVEKFAPTHLHIVTEGPIGWMMRRHALSRGYAFSTAYHTRFPEYLRQRLPVPVGLTYALMRRFHNAGAATMVSTRSMRQELESRGFQRIKTWSRGVDLGLFAPGQESDALDNLARPIFLSVGRVATEKNLPAFLALDLPGTKVVIGEGPDRGMLERRFPNAVFLGAKTHAELGGIYANADVFVFPSRTDTFGLVLIEAMACGLPVAAFPVPGPLDVVGSSGAGVLDDDLRKAALGALTVDRSLCRSRAVQFDWQEATSQFAEGLVPMRRSAERHEGQRTDMTAVSAVITR
jgi:glycosyltransferase involved in cell wall biosynthesis